MITNNEKKQTNGNIKELGYINYHRTKSVTTQPIGLFSSKKNITSFLCLSQSHDNYDKFY